MSFLITNSFKNEINKNVILETFMTLDLNQRNIFFELLINLLENIFILFHLEEMGMDVFLDRLRLNNYTDVYGFLFMLLPYISDDGKKKLPYVKSLNELYVTKIEDVDITKTNPKYLYSNIQYNRCNRDDKTAKEIDFHMDHVYHNYYLLLDTVQRISNHLYINWLQVTPYNLSTMIQSKLFDYTQKAYNSHTLQTWKYTKTQLAPYNHLYVGDIYETIYHGFYKNVKNIKWLLYNTKCIMEGEHLFRSIYYILSEYFRFCGINIVVTDEHDTDNLERFNNAWNKMIEYSNSDLVLTIQGNTETTNQVSPQVSQSERKRTVSIYGINTQMFFKAIVFFFDKYHKNKEQAKKEGYENLIYDKILRKKYDDEDDEESFIYHIEYGNVLKSLKSIPIKHAYMYILDCMSKFSSTIYNLDDPIHDGTENPEHTKTTFGQWVSATPKNLYNFAKSFCHVQKEKKFTELPPYWISLDNEYQQIILDRLNNKVNSMTWFDIKNNIARDYFTSEYGDIKYTNKKLEEINIKIYKQICEKLMINVFRHMVMSGTISKLSRFVSLQSLKQNNKKNEIMIEKYLSNESLLNEYGSANYFLNGKNFNSIIVPKKNNEDKIIGFQPYLQSMFDDDQKWWFTQYAMDWVSQINFFHKYLNNRVMYITGSTGVGKSTQAPKLFMYALKAFNHLNNGKIICTQPRKRPTEQNAQRIADEIGAPIINEEDMDIEAFKNVDSRMPKFIKSVQFKHSQKKDIQKLSDKLSLLLVTDGTLLKKITSATNVQKTKTDIKMTNFDALFKTDKSMIDNKYDIVIIDESHEHNKNMDMILTIMKYIAYYNNSLKLVIISATMDDDEPVYRRFFRNINDNKMYPLNLSLCDTQLDRINIDRRVHISLPFGGTSHVIIDKYIENTSNTLILGILKLIPNILQNPERGDVLIFAPGQAEIRKLVQEINKITPDNVIAVPYYSELTQNIKDFLEKVHIGDNKKKIRVEKSYNFADAKKVEELMIGDKKYDILIFVATNIAEASITIDTLRYVIDDGQQKISVYDYIKDTKVLRREGIAESNRMQRRGRVGRKMSGYAYYLYPKDSLLKNRMAYKICIEDITDDIYGLLISKSDVKLFDEKNDPNIIKHQKNIHNVYDKDLLKFIIKHYVTLGKFFEYVGNNKHNDYKNDVFPYEYYIGGFSSDTLTDAKGLFYIVHPEETIIQRNILGEITGVLSKKIHFQNGFITSSKMNSIWLKLLGLYIAEYTNSRVFKSDFGRKISILKDELITKDLSEKLPPMLPIKYSIAYLFSYIYGCHDKMLIILSILLSVTSITNIVNDVKKFNVLKNIFKSNTSDIEALYQIFSYVTRDINIYGEYDESIIEDKCNKHNINSRIIKQIIEKIKSISKKISAFSHFNELKSMIQLREIPTLEKVDPITISLLHAFYGNIVKNISGTPYYLYVHHPSIDNVCVIQADALTKQPAITFIDAIYTAGYALYMNMSFQENTTECTNNTISMLQYIKPEYLSILGYHIHINNLKNTISSLRMYITNVGCVELVKNYSNALIDVSDDVERNIANSFTLLNNLSIDYLENLKEFKVTVDQNTLTGGFIRTPYIIHEIKKQEKRISLNKINKYNKPKKV